MRRNTVIIILSVLCVLALVACGFSACKKIEVEPSPDGRVTPVATAMNTVYASMLAADPTANSNYFTLRFGGTYLSDDKLYDYSFIGAFDITQTNRDDDKRTELSFEVKQGGIEVFLLYYREGKLYLDFPPYARRAVISDYNFAEVAASIYAEKENGALKRVGDTLPALASRVCDGCRYFSDEDGSDRYVFTLSYKRLFESLSLFVTTWDAGFSVAELMAALHLDETAIADLSAATAPTIEFSIKDGAFRAAKVASDGTDLFELKDFSLKTGWDTLTLPAALSSFTEFDFRNFALSGTLNLSAENASSDRAAHYGVTVNRDFDEVTYPFSYDFKSHYVAGRGLEFDLSLTDPNGKASRFAIRGDYLFADLSAYGVQKLKIKTADLWERLGIAGFRDTDPYEFGDETRLISLLLAGRSEAGDVVSYDLNADFFSLLAKKLGFEGLFGTSGASLSWDTANDRLQNLSASLSFGALSLSLRAQTFTFGTVVELPAIEEAAFVDLAQRETTHLSARGTLTSHTALSTDGDFLSALLSSFSGEQIAFSAEGGVSYVADVLYGPTGGLRRLLAKLYTSHGAEIVWIYYTDETAGNFYLIYPMQSGVRKVRTLSIAEQPLAAFNEALGASVGGVGLKVALTARETSFTLGIHSPMVAWIGERLAGIYPDLDLSRFSDLDCRRYELKITDSLLTGKIVFDSDNDLTVTATSFAVTFGDDVGVAEVTAATPTALVALLADNDMPATASVRFAGDNEVYTLSLCDYLTGEKTWTYTGVPDHVAKEGQATETSVSASATLLARPLSADLRVDITPASSTMLSGSATYGGKYDVNARTFTFNLYNDVTPRSAISTFAYLTVTVGTTDYVKEIDWDLSGIATTLFYNNQQRDFTVRPKVKTYFGNEITLGAVADFTLHVNGSKATATDYSLTFVAYDGRDPADKAVYSDVLNVTTAEGIVTVDRVEWNLGKMVEIKAAHENDLYTYATADRTKPDKVKAKVYDFTGNYLELEVPVFFEKRVVTKSAFDLSAIDGVTFDESSQSFTFDVLKVRSLTPTSTDAVLPRALSANAGTDDAFEVRGLKWEFEAVVGVENASGKTGKLTLVIGDDISGHQRLRYDYAFTKAEIVKTALLDRDQKVILEKTEDIYAYSLTGLNVYDARSYRYPAYLRATFRAGSGEDSEILAAKWESDKPFFEDDLWMGGDYVLTAALGSEPLTLAMSFTPQFVTGYSFTTEELTIDESVIAVTQKEGRSCLTYSVLAALEGDSPLNYTKASGYPSKMQITTGGSAYFETDVTWDLSALKTKQDMIGIGGIVKVSANAKGQSVDVYVYVAPAVGDSDSVFVNEEKTSQSLLFRLMTPAENGFIVTDPRDPANYPEKLYVTSGATGEEYPVKVLSWSGIDSVVTLYTTGLAAGKDPNEIRGETIVKAKIGSEAVGYKEIAVPLSVVDSTIGNITVGGLPFAASSEQTGGSTPYAITPNYAAGETATFSYELSLDVNPYYVNPTSPSTYPAYVKFDLDGVPVRANAKWDLTRIPADAATDTATATYLVYAMIDLTDAFPNVLVPVAVNVLKRAIDKVWIKVKADEYSSQPYLDVDGYAAAPFGLDVEGSEVTLDVKVQFKGDANKYPLKLKYDNSAVILSYDGSALYENVTVRVGNENGGYQEVGGYSIRVISNIVSRIALKDGDKLGGTDGVFYKADYESLGSNKLVYSYQKVMDMGRELPESIFVTFGMGGTPREVYRSDSEGAAAGGVVFDWDRNDEGYIGVVLRNPSVSEEKSGAPQAIYNPEQDDYNSPTDSMFFDGEAVWTETYRDSADKDEGGNELGYITAATTLSRYAKEIKTDKVSAAYQVRYVTENYDGAPKIGAETRLDAGTYRLYVDVVGHNHYQGKVYKTFSISPKDVTSAVVLLVNGGQRKDGDSTEYTGSPFTVTAGVGTYPITVPLLVDGVASKDVTNVRYEETASGYDEAYYEFVVTVDPAARNYVVTDKTLHFMLLDAPFKNVEEALLISIRWNAGESKFDVDVLVDNEAVDEDVDLRNGYSIKFFKNNEAPDEEALSSFTYGGRYYYRIYVKVPNHTSCYDQGWVSAK
ncbi:MAG: hypothetical protein IJT69_03100 [Clostridia bacterium]|nr:hypothetical protein [Clostridia bacterium]